MKSLVFFLAGAVFVCRLAQPATASGSASAAVLMKSRREVGRLLIMIGCSKTWMFCGWNENLF
jgi:hypothetical protein